VPEEGHRCYGQVVEEAMRPIERRVLALRRQGLAVDDIARRFRRGDAHIERILEWASIPRGMPEGKPQARGFRPIESRVLDMRAHGLSYEEIGERFRRGAGYVRRIEDLARLRIQVGLAP
jgi:transcriptional regulator